MTGTGRRNGKVTFFCPTCRELLAYVRPEWVILRRLLTTNAAVSSERVDGSVQIVCQCGRRSTFRWPVLQR